MTVRKIWHKEPVSVYEDGLPPGYNGFPYCAVPGVLEFAGLKGHFKRVVDAGLRVYASDRGEFDGKPLEEDFFPDLSQEERVRLMREGDPGMLGLASWFLYYHHQGIVALESGGGWEGNGLLSMNSYIHHYENNPFSEDLVDSLRESRRIPRNERLVLKQDLELRTLRELAQRVKEGFSLGDHDFHPKQRSK